MRAGWLGGCVAIELRRIRLARKVLMEEMCNEYKMLSGNLKGRSRRGWKDNF
jgi:hypothetical protein